MDFYNDPSKVDEYEKMCEEYDGSEIHEMLEKHLPLNSSVLEIGSGPGNDIPFLKRKYSVTGSDLSDEFLKRCREKYMGVRFLKLDAVKINTKNKYECIFSNKVLHHLTMSELENSLIRQKDVISEGGLIAHTFWLGDKEFMMEGMLFIFHNRKKLLELISKYFTILESYDYKEFEDGDSIFVIARNNIS